MKIHLKANGSLTTRPGDTVLYYTEEFSPHANAINGIYIDNPPVLSSRYATLIWRYNADVDRYLLVHVQGSHAVFEAQGRNYPYRAAAEVSREDVNALCTSSPECSDKLKHLPATHLLHALLATARDYDFTKAAVSVPDEATFISGFAVRTPEATNLASHIVRAVAAGQRLVLAIPVPADGTYRTMGILGAPELATLLGAIELLPMRVARYVTWAFCADEHHATLADDVLVRIVPETSSAARNALPFSAVTARPTDIMTGHLFTFVRAAFSNLPGRDKPFATTDEMLKRVPQMLKDYAVLEKKAPRNMTREELGVWLKFLDHTVAEIALNGWETAAHFKTNLEKKEWEALCSLAAPSAATWSLEGITQGLYGDLATTREVRDAIRAKAVKTYIDREQYTWLFADSRRTKGDSANGGNNGSGGNGNSGKGSGSNMGEGAQFLRSYLTARQLAMVCGRNLSRLIARMQAYDMVALGTWQEAYPAGTVLEVDALPVWDDIKDTAKREWLRGLYDETMKQSRPTSFDALCADLETLIRDERKGRRGTVVDADGYEADNAANDADLVLARLAACPREVYTELALQPKKAGKGLKDAEQTKADQLANLDRLVTLAWQLAERKDFKDDAARRAVRDAIILAVASHCHGVAAELVGRKQKVLALLHDLTESLMPHRDGLGKVFARQFRSWTDREEDLESLREFADRLVKRLSENAKKADKKGDKKTDKKGNKATDKTTDKKGDMEQGEADSALRLNALDREVILDIATTLRKSHDIAMKQDKHTENKDNELAEGLESAILNPAERKLLNLVGIRPKNKLRTLCLGTAAALILAIIAALGTWFGMTSQLKNADLQIKTLQDSIATLNMQLDNDSTDVSPINADTEESADEKQS